MPVIVREAKLDDTPIILKYIKDLAEYEKSPLEAVLTEDDLRRSFFIESPQVYCLVSELDNVVTGIAIWHLNYSTWLGKHGVYLEDLYVDPKFRGQGHGKALLVALAKICIDRGYPRLQWWVLDWNKSAIDFYDSIGAKAMDEWTVFRVSGKELGILANSDK
ncbi:MAG: GNAT family N-acetyltransferase [Actinobacteria bacterium]|jgi:GNAT superfamily N-acetyltransferase|nr:GNAT family N-acetyltransferase [Actinomycetota bacterium]NBY82351.1 GNAT family N-acetyltransferase [Actinomycetota bacterium]